MAWLLNANRVVRSVCRAYRTSGVWNVAGEDFSEYRFKGRYPPFDIVHSPTATYLMWQTENRTLRKENGAFRYWKELSDEQKMFFSFLTDWVRREKVREFHQLSEKEQNKFYEQKIKKKEEKKRKKELKQQERLKLKAEAPIRTRRWINAPLIFLSDLTDWLVENTMRNKERSSPKTRSNQRRRMSPRTRNPPLPPSKRSSTEFY